MHNKTRVSLRNFHVCQYEYVAHSLRQVNSESRWCGVRCELWVQGEGGGLSPYSISMRQLNLILIEFWDQLSMNMDK